MSLNRKSPTNDNKTTGMTFCFFCTHSCPICTRLKTLATNLWLTHHSYPALSPGPVFICLTMLPLEVKQSNNNFLETYPHWFIAFITT